MREGEEREGKGKVGESGSASAYFTVYFGMKKELIGIFLFSCLSLFLS